MLLFVLPWALKDEACAYQT